MSVYSDLVLTHSPVIYLQADESAGSTTLIDSSVNGHDSPTQVPIVVDTGGLPSGFTSAVNFGPDNYASMPEYFEFIPATKLFTVCVWGKLPTTGANDGIYGNTLGSDAGFSFTANPSGTDGRARFQASAPPFSDAKQIDNAIPDQALNFYVWRSTGDGGEIALFVNGVKDPDTGSYTARTTTVDDFPTLGSIVIDAPATYPSNAVLCHFHIHNTALTDQQILDLYNAAGSVAPPEPPVIDVQPTNQTVLEGFEATFTSAATSSAGGMTSQWYKAPSTPVSGETTDTLVVQTAVGDSDTAYFNRYTDANGSTDTNTANLFVTAHGGGARAYLKTTIGGTGPITYQWYEDDVLMPGETSAFLYDPDPAKLYHVVATGACGEITSYKVYGDGTKL